MLKVLGQIQECMGPFAGFSSSHVHEVSEWICVYRLPYPRVWVQHSFKNDTQLFEFPANCRMTCSHQALVHQWWVVNCQTGCSHKFVVVVVVVDT